MDILDTPIPPINIFLRSSLYTSNNAGGNKNDLVFELNEPIHCDPLLDMLVSCNSFQFTNSFYTVNAYNCYLYYMMAVNQVVQTVTIPLGNYNIDTLIAKLNTLTGGYLIFSYDLPTSKTKIKSFDGTSFKLVDIDGHYNNLYETLGFDDYGTKSFDSVITSPYLYNLITIQVLHICLNNINLENVFVRNTARHNILASIHITSIFGDTQTYFNTTGYKYKINDPTTTFLNIVVLDQDFNIVNFQNIDWFLNIAFYFVTKKQITLNGTLEDHNQEHEDPNEYIIENEVENALEELNV
jgi:hypothetical protein